MGRRSARIALSTPAKDAKQVTRSTAIKSLKSKSTSSKSTSKSIRSSRSSLLASSSITEILDRNNSDDFLTSDNHSEYNDNDINDNMTVKSEITARSAPDTNCMDTAENITEYAKDEVSIQTSPMKKKRKTAYKSSNMIVAIPKNSQSVSAGSKRSYAESHSDSNSDSDSSYASQYNGEDAASLKSSDSEIENMAIARKERNYNRIWVSQLLDSDKDSELNSDLDLNIPSHSVTPYLPRWQDYESDSELDMYMTKVAIAKRRRLRLELAIRSGMSRQTYMTKYRHKRQRHTMCKTHPYLRTVWTDLGLYFDDPTDVSTYNEALSTQPVDQLKSNDSTNTDIANMAEQPKDLKLKLLPFQREGLLWLRKQELSDSLGGVLADEMGMGKTISMISLLLTAPSPHRRPSLVVAPMVAIQQWCDEIAAHIHDSGRLNVLIFHGNNRTTDPVELEEYDIVITSYAIIENSFRKQEYGFIRKGEKVKERSALHNVSWFRIILDEAHSIKDRSCSTARGAFALTSDLKWCLTGTPLQNRVGELYSLVRFMKCDPFAYYFCKRCDCKSLHWKFSDYRNCDSCGHTAMQHFCFWNLEILKPIQEWGSAGDGLVAFRKLGKLLDKIMLRRTKVQKADDLGLPPRHVCLRADYFSDVEFDFYQSLYTDSQRKFATYVTEGTVLNNYANIFDLLTKMRQAADHPDMVTTKIKAVKDINGEHIICGICHEPAEDGIMSKCRHTFCREDMAQYIQSAVGSTPPTCPVCFVKLSIDLDQPAIALPEFPNTTSTTRLNVTHPAATSIINRIDMSKWRSSTKIEALFEELTNLRRQDHTIKSIVFSQYVSFLDLCHWRLQRAQFDCVKLDGRMSLSQRDAVIKAFTHNPSVTVFLVSLKAGGVALNLTEASRVFLMDPWWNPACEDQAMDRIHRLGQYRPIRITRIIIQNSIEERIIQLQEKKRALFDSTVGKDMDALSRLTEDDLKFLFVL